MADEKKVSGKTRAGGAAKPFPWEEAIAEQYERTKSRLKGLATEPEAELQRILEQYLPKKSDSREERLQKLEDLAMGFAGSTTGKVGNVRVKSTVKDPLRMAFPGIYQRPDVIAAEAASRVAPESPNLKALFGVTRDDLYEMGKGRQGNLPGTLPGAAAKPRGSEAAARIMLPKNEQRIIDTLAEAEKYPELVRGMDPWYVMDPLFQRMEKLLGRERAIEEYTRFNTLMGMASPGTEVLTEIPRGTAAYYLQKQGRFPDFFEYAGVPAAKRGANFPADIKNVPGHMYHTTSQALPMQRYLETGEMQMDSPKVPLYIEASGVPATGFQTATPVGDAHWSRSVGLADTRGKAMRKGKEVVPGASVTNPEMTMLAPWWRESIAEPLGLESVPAQARAWGTFSGQTGVTTPIGAPKLELIADKIAETARRLGVSLEKARDLVLTGETYAGKKQGGAVGMAQGGLAQYGLRHSGEGVKGKGYFGPMAGRDGTVTELSAEDESGEFPLVVPTLTAEEIDRLLAGGEPTPEMIDKASSWAATRRKRGESPFASPTELRMPRPKAEGGSVNLTDLPDEVNPSNWREHLQNNVLADARALLGAKDGGVINLDELIEKSLKKKDGGVINLDELIAWTMAKDEHRKMKEGGAVKMQGGGNPGEVAGDMFKPKPLSIPEPITDFVEALRRQFEKEKRSMRKPGAVQDVLLRGPAAAAMGAPADIVGMGGELLDYAQKKIPALRKPASVMDTGPEKVPPMGYAPAFPLTPNEPYGTEAAQELMKQSGLTTGTERPLFEITSGVAAPFAGMAAVKTGKALVPTAKEMTQFALEKSMEPYQMNIIKPEGGNWIQGAAEKYLKDLRYDESLIDPVGVMNPADKAEETARVAAMNNFVDKKLSRYLVNQMGTPSDPLRLQADTWAETQKKLLADKDKQIDKVRSDIRKAQQARGVDPEVLTRSQARLRELQKERDLIKNRKGLHYEPLSTDVTVFGAERRRKDLGAPRERMAKSEIGQNWEDRADLSVQQSSYMKQPEIGVPKTYAEFVEAAAGDRIVDKAILDRINTELEKMGGKYALENPEALAYRTTGDPSKVGFDHMMDEIDNALRPNQGLPEYLQLKPKDLDKMSVAQVAEHVDKINAWRASQKAEVDAARAANAATVEHKAYDVVPGTDIPNDQGLRWVEIKVPEMVEDFKVPDRYEIRKPTPSSETFAIWDKEANQYITTGIKTEEAAIKHLHDTINKSAVEDALKYEGEILQHCVGGYCPDVLEGRSRIFSLRDAEGRPHATIETKPIKETGRRSDIPDDIKEELRARGEAIGRQKADELGFGPYSEEAALEEKIAIAQLMDDWLYENPLVSEKIAQIKGLQNKKPNDEYMPFIQDFVKSGQWSEVGDLHNTGLFKVTQGQKLPGFAKEIPPGYYTLDDFQKMAVENEMPQEILDNWMNRLGGRRFFGMKRGGRVTKADLEQQFRMAFGGGVFNTDPDITDAGRIIPEHTI